MDVETRDKGPIWKEKIHINWEMIDDYYIMDHILG